MHVSRGKLAQNRKPSTKVYVPKQTTFYRQMCNYYVIACISNLFLLFFPVCVLVTSVTVNETSSSPTEASCDRSAVTKAGGGPLSPLSPCTRACTSVSNGCSVGGNYSRAELCKTASKGAGPRGGVSHPALSLCCMSDNADAILGGYIT